MSKMRENQVSVPLDAQLGEFLERRAAREERTVAGMARIFWRRRREMRRLRSAAAIGFNDAVA
jgi:hypothetical protein